MKTKNILIILLGTLIAYPSFASIKISPVKIDLSNDQPRATIRLKNTDNTPLILKSGIAKRVKKGNEVVFVPNKDIIAVPRKVQIKPGSEKTVRLALRSKTKKDKTYYLTLLRKAKPREKIALAKKEKISPGVKMNVQLDIPIFVKAKKGEAKKLALTKQHK